MPIRTTYDAIICITSYIMAGGVMNMILNYTLSFLGSLISLSIIAIIVYFIKKWLAKEDYRINKNGGFISFIKAYFKK